MAALAKLVYNNKLWSPTDPIESFEGRNVIVTGSNVGLGFEAAIKFAKLGASRLILAVRSLEKGEKAKQNILQRNGGPVKGIIEVWHLDMDSYDSIKTFVERVEKEIPTLDVVVLNAGVWSASYERSSYGWEHILQVNCLSTSLLALLLRPKLKTTKQTTGVPPTLELVSSGTIYRVYSLLQGSKPGETLGDNLLEHYSQAENFNARKQYAVSKLFVQCVIATLAQEVSESLEKGEPDAWVVSVCPGLCQSDLSRDLDSLFYSVVRTILFTTVCRTTEQGSRTLVSGTTLGQKGHGEFWQHDTISRTAPLLAGEEGKTLREKVWRQVLDALLKDVPDLKERAGL